MKISSRFTIAVHTLLCILEFKDEKITSNFISESVNVNPVIIRNILIQLQKADIITVKRGTGGISLNKKTENITLLDIFNAVESLDEGKLFSFHENPNKK
ncbi:Rrf2 family transcriptional regulator [Brachyspira hampsonii]|nr:Rrf2 family transcriptional regulator [Brachyspira hampsonii]